MCFRRARRHPLPFRRCAPRPGCPALTRLNAKKLVARLPLLARPTLPGARYPAGLSTPRASAMSARTPRVGGGRTNRTPRSGRTQTTKDSGTKASLRTCDLTGNAWLERQTAKIEAKTKEVQDLYVGNQFHKTALDESIKNALDWIESCVGRLWEEYTTRPSVTRCRPFMHIDEVDAHDAHAPIKPRKPKPVKGKHVWKTRCSDDAPDFFLTDAAKALRDGHMTLPKHRRHALRRAALLGGPIGDARAARARWTCPGASADGSTGTLL